MIAIHGGASMKVCGDEHKVCAKSLRSCNGDVVAAITTLERNAMFNCGYGSNLTASGRVECEAAYMTSRQLAFGAVGALSRCITPCLAAKALASAYQTTSSDGWTLVPPICLVGEGADAFCRRTAGVSTVDDNAELQSTEAKRCFRKGSRMVRQDVARRLDTVGGVALLTDGTAESCVSSGGMLLKHDGRLSHCPQFGAGVWSERRDDASVAISLTGCGEALVRTRLAERLAERCFQGSLESGDSPHVVKHIHDVLADEFVGSPRLAAFPPDRRRVGGLLAWRHADGAELFVFHNTPYLPFVFVTGGSVKRRMSTVADDSPPGAIVLHSFTL